MRPAVSGNSNVPPPYSTIDQTGAEQAAAAAAAPVRACAGQPRAGTSFQPQAPRPAAETKPEIKLLEAAIAVCTKELDALDAEVARLRLQCAQQQPRAAGGCNR